MRGAVFCRAARKRRVQGAWLQAVAGARMISAAARPHPALRATFSRKREEGGLAAVGGSSYAVADEGRFAPPLPLAGEGWGEGQPLRRHVRPAQLSRPPWAASLASRVLSYSASSRPAALSASASRSSPQGAGSPRRQAARYSSVPAAPERIAAESIALMKRSGSSRFAEARPALTTTWLGMSRQ